MASAGSTVEIYFMRHGQSIWNRRIGSGNAVELLREHRLLQGADKAVMKRLFRWLEDPSLRCMREDPAEQPPADVAALEGLLVDPPLTLEGRRQLHAVSASAQASLALDPGAFHACIVSPMLRTIQSAVIAARHLPLNTCKWVFDADAREHNHPTWIDTWGTGSLATLRGRVAGELEVVAAGEAAVCALRPQLQSQALAREEFADVREALLADGGREEAVSAFLASLNPPPQSTADDARALADEAEEWTRVQETLPEFLYRPGGAVDQAQIAALWHADLVERWWLLDESESLLDDRVRRLVASDAVRGAQGRGHVMVVTHSMLIARVMEMYIDGETAWAGPSPRLEPKKLVPNGGIFRMVFDLEKQRAVEAGLYVGGCESCSMN